MADDASPLCCHLTPRAAPCCPPPPCRSEPESALLHKVVDGYHPHVWLNVHSGMEALFMPYDHMGNIPGEGGPLSQGRVMSGWG